MAQPSVLKSSQPHSVSLPEGSSVATRKPVRKPDEQEPQAGATGRSSRHAGTLQDDPVAVPAIIARDPQAARTLTELPKAAPAAAAPAVMSDAIARRLEELKRRNDNVRATLARQAATGRTKTP